MTWTIFAFFFGGYIGAFACLAIVAWRDSHPRERPVRVDPISDGDWDWDPGPITET